MPEYNHQDYRGSNYINATISPRFQPFPPPFNTAHFAQRVPVGTQFDGRTPNAEQEKIGDVTGPGSGGRWMWGEDVMLTRFEFQSIGVEPGVGRVAGNDPTSGRAIRSGLYVVRKDAMGLIFQLVLDLSSVEITAVGTKEWIGGDFAPVRIKQGEILKCITFGATLEMIATATVENKRVYLGGS